MATILDYETANPYAPVMARFLQFLCVAIILCHPVFSQPENAVPMPDFSSYYQELKRVGRPHEGTPEESAVLAVLSSNARRFGFRTDTTGVQDARSFHSFARSLRVVVPGTGPEQVSLIIPLDAPRGDSDADPWLGPAAGLWLMDRLKGSPVRNTVVLEFLGADDGMREAGLGTRRLLLDSSLRQRICNIYFNWNQPRAVWRLPHGMTGNLSPAWLLALACADLEKSGITLELPMISSQLHRIGLGRPNQLGPYLAAGLPTIELTPDPDSALVDIRDAAVLLLPALVSLLDAEFPAEARKPAGSWDGNYLVLTLAGRHLVLSELSIVLFFMSGLVLLLLIVYFRRTRRHRYLKAFLRHWHSFLAVLAACVVANLAAWTAIWLTIPDWSQLPTYRNNGLAIIVLRLVFTAGALFAASPFLGRRIASQSSFHGSAAFLACLGLVVAIAVYNVTLSIYALLAAVFISLSNLAKLRWIKTSAALSAAAALLAPIVEAWLQAPGTTLDRILLKDPLSSTLVFTCLLLPLCFLACRLWLVLPVRRPRYRLLRRITVCLLIAGSLASLAVLGFVIGQEAARHAAINLAWEPDSKANSGVLMVTGDPVLQAGTMVFRDQSLAIDATFGSSLTFTLPAGQAPKYTCKASSLGFLDRKTITLTIDGSAPVSSCRLRLSAADLLTIHALDFPFRYLDSQTIELFIGEYPPLPLSIGLTVPGGGQISYRCELSADEAADFQPHGLPHRRLSCRSTVSLSGKLP
jgi:hypothetical protein